MKREKLIARYDPEKNCIVCNRPPETEGAWLRVKDMQVRGVLEKGDHVVFEDGKGKEQ